MSVRFLWPLALVHADTMTVVRSVLPAHSGSRHMGRNLVGSPARAARVTTAMDVTNPVECGERIHTNLVTTNSMGSYSLSLGGEANWNLSDVKSRSRT